MRGSRSGSERMMEPGSLAGSPKWMKMLGTGPWVVEEDGRISQPTCDTTVAEGNVRLASFFERDVVIPSAPSLGESQTIRCPGTRVSTRKKKQRGKQKLTSSFGYARRCRYRSSQTGQR